MLVYEFEEWLRRGQGAFVQLRQTVFLLTRTPNIGLQDLEGRRRQLALRAVWLRQLNATAAGAHEIVGELAWLVSRTVLVLRSHL